MIKIIYRTLISLIILLLVIVVYLSTIGVKTNKFNSKIISQIKQIEPNIELKLNEVSATFDPFNFEINAKTIGTDLTYRDKIIKIQSITSNISLMSFLKSELNAEFSVSWFITNTFTPSATFNVKNKLLS